jgi:hypothetical protein
MDRPFDLTPYALCRNFTEMKFEFDKIEQISDSFFLDTFTFLWSVESFSLRGNKLEKIPEKFFQNFDLVIQLDLSENLFENISDLAFANGKFFLHILITNISTNHT